MHILRLSLFFSADITLVVVNNTHPVRLQWDLIYFKLGLILVYIFATIKIQASQIALSVPAECYKCALVSLANKRSYLVSVSSIFIHPVVLVFYAWPKKKITTD